jgi:hypothetical protein
MDYATKSDYEHPLAMTFKDLQYYAQKWNCTVKQAADRLHAYVDDNTNDGIIKVQPAKGGVLPPQPDHGHPPSHNDSPFHAIGEAAKTIGTTIWDVDKNVFTGVWKPVIDVGSDIGNALGFGTGSVDPKSVRPPNPNGFNPDVIPPSPRSKLPDKKKEQEDKKVNSAVFYVLAACGAVYVGASFMQ